MTSSHRRSVAAALALTSALALASTPAHADVPVDAAADAYDRGAAAQAAGDQAAAAREFARADALVPSDVALEAALDACDQARGEVVLCRELTERARRTSSPRVTELANRLRPKLAALPPSVITPAPLATSAPPPPVAPASSAPTTGISPAWAIVGAGLTAATLVATGISWADAKSVKERFASDGCLGAGSDDCDSLGAHGRSTVTRTNVLLGASVVLAAGTILLSALFVKWSDTPRRVGDTGGAFVF